MTLTVHTFTSRGDAGPALRKKGAHYVGGGTLVVRALNEGDVSISDLVRVKEPALSAIEVSGGRVRTGAAATMAAVAAHADLAFLAPAALAIGGPAVRNMATVGGNLFAPTPYGDFATALLALDALAEVDGDKVPLGELLDGRSGAYRGRVVAAVDFDVPAQGSFRFVKVSRVKPNGISVVAIAAVIEESDGVITSARIALGSMADRPIRATAAEAALAGKPRTRDGIADALAAAAEGTAPADDAIASAWYRREVLPVHLGRLLLA